MRLRLLLALAFLPPLAAHGDDFSDLVLVGDGHTISFSLPTVYDAPNVGRPYNPYYLGLGTALIDGATTDPVNVSFFGPPTIPGGGDFYFTNQFAGIGEIDLAGGTHAVKYGPPVMPTDYLAVSLVPGTYNYVSDGLGANEPPSFTNFTLTITAQSATTPEPSSIVFLATGLLGFSGVVVRKCVRQRAAPASFPL